MIDEEIFELTRSPYYNEIIKSARTVYEDNFSAPSVMELKEHIKIFSDFLKQFREVFEEQKEIGISHPSVDEENRNIEINLADLENVRKSLLNIIIDKNGEIFLNELKKGKELVNSLFSSFDVIRKIEEESPKYSSVALVHEFLSVAKGVLEKKFHVKHLQKNVEPFKKQVMEKYEELLVMKKASNISELPEEILLIEKSYEQLLSGFEEIEKFLKNKNSSLLSKGMEIIKEHSEKLVELQQKLEAPREEPKTRLCFRCGTENLKAARYCIKCRMEIPAFEIKDNSSYLDIKLQEDQVVSTQPVMTENIYKLSMAVENYLSGKISKENFSDAVEWIERKIKKSRKQFENQKKKKPDKISEKDKDIIKQMEELTERGLFEYEKALKQFSEFFKTEDDRLLRDALEKATEANEKLYKVQTIFQKQN